MGNRLLINPMLKTLRDNRGAIIGWTITLLLFFLVTVGSYHSLLGKDVPDRAAQLAGMSQALSAFGSLLGEIVPIDTVGGFVTLRLLASLPVIVGIWAVIAGAGLIRGEEEQGTLDVHQAEPVSRMAMIGQKFAGFTLTSGIIAVAGWLILYLSGAAFNEPLSAGGAGLTMLNVMTLAWFWGAVALLMGQLFLTRRVAAGVAGAAMVAAYSFDVNLYSTPTYKTFSWLSPFHYYSLNKPLVPGRGFDWGSWLVLIVLGLLFFAGAALLYRRRDIGATAFGGSRRGRAPKPRTGGSLAGLGGLFARSMRDLLGPAIAWTAGLVVYILLVEYSVPALIEPLKALAGGAFGPILGSVVGTMGILQFLLLAVVTLVIAGFGLFQVAAWTGDEEAGRLELVLSTPHGRGAVLLARFAALVVITALMVLVMGVTILLVAPAAGITVEADKVWAGMVGLVPFALATAAAGWAIGAFLKRPGPAVLIVGAVLAAMYFLDTLGPLFKLPDAVLGISIFHAYGRPFLDGLNTGGLLAFSAATLLLLAAALWGFQRRDVVK